MKQKLVAVMLTLAMTAALAACGSKAEAPAEAPAETEAPAEAEAPEAEAPEAEQPAAGGADLASISSSARVLRLSVRPRDWLTISSPYWMQALTR